MLSFQSGQLMKVRQAQVNIIWFVNVVCYAVPASRRKACVSCYLAYADQEKKHEIEKRFGSGNLFSFDGQQVNNQVLCFKVKIKHFLMEQGFTASMTMKATNLYFFAFVVKC